METASEIVQNHDAYLNLRRSNLKITLIDLISFKSTKEKKKKDPRVTKNELNPMKFDFPRNIPSLSCNDATEKRYSILRLAAHRYCSSRDCTRSRQKGRGRGWLEGGCFVCGRLAAPSGSAGYPTAPRDRGHGLSVT